MSDDLKRAMQKLEWHTRGYDEDECSRQMSAAEARTILAALRSREQAIAEARAEEREACAKVCDDYTEEERAVLGRGQGEWPKPSYFTNEQWARIGGRYSASMSLAAAIRARGER